MRLPSDRRTWWKETSLVSVAEYSFTGIVTSPKLMAPFQIDLMTTHLPRQGAPDRRRVVTDTPCRTTIGRRSARENRGSEQP